MFYTFPPFLPSSLPSLLLSLFSLSLLCPIPFPPSFFLSSFPSLPSLLICLPFSDVSHITTQLLILYFSFYYLSFSCWTVLSTLLMLCTFEIPHPNLINRVWIQIFVWGQISIPAHWRQQQIFPRLSQPFCPNSLLRLTLENCSSFWNV